MMRTRSTGSQLQNYSFARSALNFRKKKGGKRKTEESKRKVRAETLKGGLEGTRIQELRILFLFGLFIRFYIFTVHIMQCNAFIFIHILYIAMNK